MKDGADEKYNELTGNSVLLAENLRKDKTPCYLATKAGQADFSMTYVVDVLVNVRVKPIVNDDVPSTIVVAEIRAVPPVL